MRSLLHFLLLGGLLFGAQRLAAMSPLFAAPQTIHIRSVQLANLQASWQLTQGGFADTAQRQRAIQQLADEEILLREALRLGMNRSDPVVQSRLLQNLRFAYPDSTEDDDTLLRKALALRMDERDFVVRQRLIQRMQQRLATGAAVTDEALRRDVAAHPQRYATAVRLSFQQVFLSADVHGPNLQAAAERLRPTLGTDTAVGDPFLAGRRIEGASEADLSKLFGHAFARDAMLAAPGQWTGPIASPYGLHFIYIESVLAAEQADLATVRQRASYAVLEQAEQRRVQEALVELRRRYAVVVDAPALTLGDRR